MKRPDPLPRPAAGPQAITTPARRPATGWQAPASPCLPTLRVEAAGLVSGHACHSDLQDYVRRIVYPHSEMSADPARLNRHGPSLTAAVPARVHHL